MDIGSKHMDDLRISHLLAEAPIEQCSYAQQRQPARDAFDILDQRTLEPTIEPLTHTFAPGQINHLDFILPGIRSCINLQLAAQHPIDPKPAWAPVTQECGSAGKD